VPHQSVFAFSAVSQTASFSHRMLLREAVRAHNDHLQSGGPPTCAFFREESFTETYVDAYKRVMSVDKLGEIIISC
jgi:hypothetical protein